MRRLRDVIQFFYDGVLRDHLPAKLSLWNGVAVRGQVKLLDFTDSFPTYEAALIEALRQQVESGDNVVIVGGGKGVSTVIAAERTGLDGSVTCFEGSSRQVDRVRQTVQVNQVTSQVQIRHSVVSEFSEFSNSTFGAEEDANTIAPSALPQCDILELDCEGAELSILTEMEISPEVIIVETHGFLDAPESEIRARLDERNYEIIARGTEDMERGVFILTAVRNDSSRLPPVERS